MIRTLLFCLCVLRLVRHEVGGEHAHLTTPGGSILQVILQSVFGQAGNYLLVSFCGRCLGLSLRSIEYWLLSHVNNEVGGLLFHSRQFIHSLERFPDRSKKRRQARVLCSVGCTLMSL